MLCSNDLRSESCVLCRKCDSSSCSRPSSGQGLSHLQAVKTGAEHLTAFQYHRSAHRAWSWCCWCSCCNVCKSNKRLLLLQLLAVLSLLKLAAVSKDFICLEMLNKALQHSCCCSCCCVVKPSFLKFGAATSLAYPFIHAHTNTPSRV